MSFLNSLSARSLAAPESGIVEVKKYAHDREILFLYGLAKAIYRRQPSSPKRRQMR